MSAELTHDCGKHRIVRYYTTNLVNNKPVSLNKENWWSNSDYAIHQRLLHIQKFPHNNPEFSEETYCIVKDKNSGGKYRLSLELSNIKKELIK